MINKRTINAERKRLEAQRQGKEQWDKWGPYLAERAWGTVREDYSEDGNVWEYFDHNQSRKRAYRWSEDGLGGICDDQQTLCFAIALWNGQDAILKERAFGLTGKQGNHGEDVKEVYFYLDATPSHSYLRYNYCYPQGKFPYKELLAENQRRGFSDTPYNLMDTGIFAENRFWDVDVVYAKKSSDEIHIRITVTNRGPDTATLDLLPTLWFRNTWSWDKEKDEAKTKEKLKEKREANKPNITKFSAANSPHWAVKADHQKLGSYYLYGQQAATDLFTENESNAADLWGEKNTSPFVKDAFHRHIIQGEQGQINPENYGTKYSAWHHLTAVSGNKIQLGLVLSSQPLEKPFQQHEQIILKRLAEANDFYHDLLPEAKTEDRVIMRQAYAGMIWNKQFYHFDVNRWLDGDQVPAPNNHKHGRNQYWRHFKAANIMSMPDCWEYPWFAAWDLAYHCCALALLDIDFAKQQMELVLSENMLHPNGQLPAYEWAFGDSNPPVHAMGVLKVFRADRIQRGEGDLGFLKRVFHKLLLSYTWWINRKDTDGHNVFEGGFMGLDNISVLNRSEDLPIGYSLKQADATGWMAMFSLNMTVIALELAVKDSNYEDIAIQTYSQFLSIANTIAGHGEQFISLWDEEAGFFKDVIVSPDGQQHHIDVYSWVGLIPLFATEVIDKRLLSNVPRFREILSEHRHGNFNGNIICQCPEWENDRGEHLLALVSEKMLPRILARLLNENEFLSEYGVRSVSRAHAEHTDLGILPGIGQAMIEYVPGESNSGLFGGNSNWRGPVWVPTNYSLIQALEKYFRFLGENFKVSVPGMNNQEMSLREICDLLAERLVNLYRQDNNGKIPAYGEASPCQNGLHNHLKNDLQKDLLWKEKHLFYEYFHGETGQGLGAAHQTGWTGLLANLVIRCYRQDIPEFWRMQ